MLPKGGAKIDNTKIMRLKDAITQECTKEVNIQECMKKMSTVFDMTEQERASQYLKKNTRRIAFYKDNR